MKKIYLALILLVIISSCKKGETLLNDNGCITQIRRENFGIKPADSLAAIHLFQQNNISYSNLSFERITLNDTIGGHIYQHIFATQSFNGLQIMSGDAGYHFMGGTYQSTDGKVYTSVKLDNHSHLSLSQVRGVFMSETIDKRGFNPTYRDSCLKAQFGYYDLNAGTGNESVNLVKAWRVELKSSTYPQVIIRDDNGKLIVFDPGVETLN